MLWGSSQPLPTGMLLESRGQGSGHRMGSKKRFPKGKADVSPSHMLLNATQPGATISVTVNDFHYFSLLLEFNVVQIKWGLYGLHAALLYPCLSLTPLPESYTPKEMGRERGSLKVMLSRDYRVNFTPPFSETKLDLPS